MIVRCMHSISRQTLLILVAVFVVVAVLLAAAVVLLVILVLTKGEPSSTAVHDPSGMNNSSTEPAWNRPTCSSTCDKDEYSSPHNPLVIISLNGFAKPLLEHNLKSLANFAKCGVSSEALLPCFPLEERTNLVALATGLYPESQHLRTPLPSSNRSTANSEPIWQVYRRMAGGVTAVHSWPIDPYDDASRPDYVASPHRQPCPLHEQLEQVLRWLAMPNSTRPGLIMVSNDDIVNASRTSSSQAGIIDALSKIDNALDAFFSQLYQKGILNCVNIAIVSNQGFIETSNRYNLTMSPDLSNAVFFPGPITRIYGGNGSDPIEHQWQFSSRSSGVSRVFSRFSAPTRWHCCGSDSSPDLLVIPEPGVELCWNCTGDKGSAAMSGMDYQDEHMQTIFFARGPSIRSGKTVPAFQNVELMNLWLNLLNLSHVPNNGSSFFPQQILRASKPLESVRKYGISECRFTNDDSVINCGGCTILQQVRVSKWMGTCAQPNRHLVMLSSSSSSLCYQKICEKLVITGIAEDESVALVEIFHKNNTMATTQNGCLFVSARYESTCPAVVLSEDQELRSLSANPRKVLARVATLHVPWNVLFLKDVLEPLNTYTMALSSQLGRVIIITGTAYDRDLDGIADQNKTGSPTHLYRILVKCTSTWSTDGFFCRNPVKTEVLAFLFPQIKGDVNGLPSGQLLLQYTARLKDVELISGIEFDLPLVPVKHMMHLRLHITTKLW